MLPDLIPTFEIWVEASLTPKILAFSMSEKPAPYRWLLSLPVAGPRTMGAAASESLDTEIGEILS